MKIDQRQLRENMSGCQFIFKSIQFFLYILYLIRINLYGYPDKTVSFFSRFFFGLFSGNGFFFFYYLYPALSYYIPESDVFCIKQKLSNRNPYTYYRYETVSPSPRRCQNSNSPYYIIHATAYKPIGLPNVLCFRVGKKNK